MLSSQNEQFWLFLALNSRTNTARKNGFALSLIRIKGVVKCNNSFDTTFDAHQIISQICDAFTYTFDSNQR